VRNIKVNTKQLSEDAPSKKINTDNLFGYFPPDKSKKPKYHRHENKPKGNVLSLFGLVSVGKSPRYRKHKDKSNHSIMPGYDNNPNESNKITAPSSDINTSLPNIDYIPRYDKNMDIPNGAVIPAVDSNSPLRNINPRPISDDNTDINDNLSISSDVNPNATDAINILSFKLNPDKPNTNPVPIANIISTGQ
jgi:hypothetical protein